MFHEVHPRTHFIDELFISNKRSSKVYRGLPGFLPGTTINSYLNEVEEEKQRMYPRAPSTITPNSFRVAVLPTRETVV